MKLFYWLTLGLALAISAPPAATAQPHPPQPQPGRGQGFFVTTFSAVSTDSGKRRVVVTYRLPRNFLVFTRDEAGAATPGYTARCDVSFELRDAQGTPVVQRLTTRTFHSADNAERAPDTLSYSGGFNIEVVPGEFSARFEATDVESKRITGTILSQLPYLVIHPTVSPCRACSSRLSNRTHSATV